MKKVIFWIQQHQNFLTERPHFQQTIPAGPSTTNGKGGSLQQAAGSVQITRQGEANGLFPINRQLSPPLFYRSNGKKFKKIINNKLK